LMRSNATTIQEGCTTSVPLSISLSNDFLLAACHSSFSIPTREECV
jgi:hypothetical protein